jgi:hypothetical protein
VNWSTAVIIGLCALNLLALLFLARKGASLPRPVNLAGVLNDPKMGRAQVALNQIRQGAFGAAPPPKDTSVILMTEERDSRLLDEDQ